MNKKIAYLVSMYPAPSHTFIRREIEALRLMGLEIHTFSIRRPDRNAKFSPNDQSALDNTFYIMPFNILKTGLLLVRFLVNTPVWFLKTFKKSLTHRIKGINGFIKAIAYFIESVILADQLQKREINHIHNHFANPGANVGYLTSSYLGIPWSLTLHGLSDFSYPSDVLLPEKIKAAAFVACVTSYGKAQAYRITNPLLWDKIFVSRCGIEMSRLPKKNRKKSDGFRILTVGRLSPEKGQHGLIEAFAKVLQSGINAELKIIGNGPEYDNLRQQVMKLHIDECCTFTGQLPEQDVLDAMAESDLFVLSSFMEGLPVVLMEALGMKIPVIAPCVAGIPELVKHNVSGKLFIPGDWDELSKVIINVIQNYDSALAYAKIGHRYIRENYDIAKAVIPISKRFLD